MNFDKSTPPSNYVLADAESDKNEIVKILNERRSRIEKNKTTSDAKASKDCFASEDFADGIVINAHGFVGLTPIDRNGPATEAFTALSTPLLITSRQTKQCD